MLSVAVSVPTRLAFDLFFVLSLLPLAIDLATIPRGEFQLAVFFVVTASIAVIATPATVVAFVLPRVGSSGLEPSERG